MSDEDEALSTLRRAIARQFEVSFNLRGVPDFTMEPHVIYTAADGALTVAGFFGNNIYTQVPISQIKGLTITARPFQINAAFNLDDARYDNALAIVKR